MSPKMCENCYVFFDDTNGYMTEDGKHACCSEECLEQLEEDLAANRDDERFQHVYFEAMRGV